jgi:F0F1-type ATP synthase membrane subunit b/b'
MIEEFIQQVQQAEVEADALVRAAKEKVQEIERNSESALVQARASAEASLEQRFRAIDQEADEQIKLVEEQSRRDLQEQLADLDKRAQSHRSAALDLLLSKLITLQHGN